MRSKICGINGCRSYHHRMLHEDQVSRVNTEEQDTVSGTKPLTSGSTREGKSNERTHTTTTEAEPALSATFVVLRTVPVYLTSGRRRIKVNILLDDGSSRTYLNSDIAAELGLEGNPHELTINVLNDHQEKLETTVVEFTMGTSNGTAYTTEKVTGNMQVIDWRKCQTKWKHLKGIEFPQVSPKTTVE